MEPLRATASALTQLDGAEIGFAGLGLRDARYAFLDDGRIACIVTRDAVESLELLDPERGDARARRPRVDGVLGRRFAAGGGRVVVRRGVADERRDPRRRSTLRPGARRSLRRSLDVELDPASISCRARSSSRRGDGAVAHAFYYPPTSAEWEGPADELPPLRVICHGGPTGTQRTAASTSRSSTSRSAASASSTSTTAAAPGYGREYRRLLNGRWGEIDWQDCVDAARHLADEGEADPERTWVEGGSAGGYVVFCALVFEPAAFAAGVSYFGVADAEALALDTHKFESRYLDSMIGPYPERADLYRERSPVHFADRLERPLLLLQGLDDKVVLPSQAEMMVEVLERKGIPHAYLAFEGEGHGFRKQANVAPLARGRRSRSSLRSSGSQPADELEPLELTPAR